MNDDIIPTALCTLGVPALVALLVYLSYIL